MTTMGLGAAKRHAINETVRLRMAALLPTDDEPSGGSGGSGDSGEGLPGAASPPVGERPVPATGSPPAAPPPLPTVGGADDPDEAVRSRATSLPSFASALALDRRAVAGLTILLLFAVGYAVQHFWLARPETVAVPALAAVAAPAQADPSVPADAAASRAGPGVGTEAAPGVVAAVVVDIGGRVHLPGLHTLPGGSRVADALRAAGGPLPETDTRNLNLARLLTDGEQILVGEQAPALAPAVGSGNGPPGPAAPRPPVSLNRATLEQLDALPGVGPTLAQRILAYRTSHGSFRSLDQLRQVSGIGARTYAELRPLLTL
ncbi:helix-hairpin-helix domain-containing protein [Kitasatospora brasiliensis]|uniref:helix-hairpin-helix domain-containing protein n=1 Tax=Kitasatospora brasiliensis TaxID=3058040 RepID=UPI0029301985|nr:helix-hairpin-helix domain-containing protein [Kitasatospora sp. K002]